MTTTPEPVVLARLAREGTHFADLLDRLPAIVGLFRGPDLVIELANPQFQRLAPGEPLVGRPVAECFSQPENRPFMDLLRQVFRTGEPARESEWRAVVCEPETGAEHELYLDFAYLPLRDAAGAVEGVLVHAVDITEEVGARRRAEESERRLRALVDSNVVGVATSDEERILEANDAFLAMVGRDRAELEAGQLSWRAITPPESAPADRRALGLIAREGWVEPYEKEYLRPDGSRVPALVSGVRVDVHPLRVMALYIDLSHRRSAERERERLLSRERDARREAELAAGRTARLQRVTAALAAAISPDEIGRATVEQAVEAVGASAGVIALVDGDHLVLRYEVGYAEEDVTRWRRFPLDTQGPLAEVVRTAAPVMVETRAEWARYPRLTGMIHRFSAFTGVPFIFGGEVLGAMGLSFVEPRALSGADRGFLLALGHQAAQALERARLYERRAYVARSLQHGLLPERLAHAPGLEVAVRYHSIADGGEVGGDFYDFFETRSGHWLAATGDVSGKGVGAAVLTGLARHTLRAIALREEAPREILRLLNEAVRRQSDSASFCTVGCAALTPAAGGYRAWLASGGHPYPVLARAGGRAAEVRVRGTLLGIEHEPRLEQIPLDLGPGDVLVSYTDGVIDARSTSGERFGEAGLLAAVDAAAGGDAEAVAQAIDDAVHRHEDERRDDRAIVVLRVEP